MTAPDWTSVTPTMTQPAAVPQLAHGDDATAAPPAANRSQASLPSSQDHSKTARTDNASGNRRFGDGFAPATVVGRGDTGQLPMGFASNQREDSNMPIRSTERFNTSSLALAAIMALGLSGPALANPVEATTAPPTASTQQAAAEPFTAARFAALQADNALILVDVAATWCPTCKAQKAVIDAFRQQHPELGLHVLTVDFDTQKEWVKHFKAPRQSTLLVYKGSEQRWFAVAETREDVITAALRQAASS